MPVHIDRYRLKLQFQRLFADPRLFQDNSNLARLFLQEHGLGLSKTHLIIELERFRARDRKGEDVRIRGTASYNFQGKKTRSEYMENVTISEEYFDLGTGIRPSEHQRFWSTGRLWAMPFSLETFDHEPFTLEIPDAGELYTMIKAQAQPTTIASVELDLLGDQFDLALNYLEGMLGRMAEADGLTLEIYASRYLDFPERTALDRRLTRESTDSTVYVILGRN